MEVRPPLSWSNGVDLDIWGSSPTAFVILLNHPEECPKTHVMQYGHLDTLGLFTASHREYLYVEQRL